MPGLPLSMPPIMPPMSSMTAPMFPTMPGMMSLDSRPPPIGRMSPPTDSGRNRSFAASRSPSPDSYDRGYRRSSYRDSSPTSRSERRLSPRRPSPTRSDRGYRDRREYPDYRDRDNRYYSSNGRDTSPDRFLSIMFHIQTNYFYAIFMRIPKIQMIVDMALSRTE